MSKSTPNVIFSTEPVFAIDADWFEKLKGLALSAANKRARICLHKDLTSDIQQMLIVFHQSTFIGPHRQNRDFKSYCLLSGKLSVSFFESEGRLVEHRLLGDMSSSHPPFLRFNASRWHMAVPVTEWVAFVETGEGPFTSTSTEYAPWGPNYDDPGAVRRFLDKIDAEQPHAR